MIPAADPDHAGAAGHVVPFPPARLMVAHAARRAVVLVTAQRTMIFEDMAELREVLRRSEPAPTPAPALPPSRTWAVLQFLRGEARSVALGVAVAVFLLLLERL